MYQADKDRCSRKRRVRHTATPDTVAARTLVADAFQHLGPHVIVSYTIMRDSKNEGGGSTAAALSGRHKQRRNSGIASASMRLSLEFSQDARQRAQALAYNARRRSISTETTTG